MSLYKTVQDFIGEPVGVSLPITINTKKTRIGRATFLGEHQYHYLCGQSGAGKTAIAHALYVINLYEYWKSKPWETEDVDRFKPQWIIRSMERPGKWTKAKWLAFIIYLKEGHVLDKETILQQPNKKRQLTDKDKNLIDKWVPYCKDMMKDIDIIDGAASPDQIRSYIHRVMRRRGTVVEAKVDHVLVNGQKYDMNGQETVSGVKKNYFEGRQGKVYEGETKYFPNDPEEIVVHMTDHLSKWDNHDTIGLHGKYMREAADIYGLQIVDINQLNRDNQNANRRAKFGVEILESDIRGSSIPYHNADVVWGLISPEKLNSTSYKANGKFVSMKEITSDNGANRFRSLKLLKNSNGAADFEQPLWFVGEMGYVEEITEPIENYSKYTDI